MAGVSVPSDPYSPWVGIIYIFNLIVGTGALTLPAAFLHSGWLLGLCLLVFLAFVSYVTATFVIESMAAANAVIKWQSIEKRKKKADEVLQDTVDSTGPENEREPLVDNFDQGYRSIANDQMAPNRSSQLSPNLDLDGHEEDFFNITQQVEMGKMAQLFFSKFGLALFYMMIAVYLYGDLAIYCAAIAKSLRDVSCTYVPPNQSCNGTSPDAEFCWGPDHDLSRRDVYRIFVGIFIALVGPFTFFNVQKTKVLQLFTSVLRWIAFSTMIILASLVLIRHGPTSAPREIANPMGLSNFIGICVYSFMCHHSLPALVTPFSEKRLVGRFLAFDYTLILAFYSLLALTGIFAFNPVPDLYTLTFQPNRCDPGQNVTDLKFVQYFLSLFPVFTLSTNFPIISITLRENLKSLLSTSRHRRRAILDRVLYPLVALIPPVVVALMVSDLEFLVGVTGSYAGVGIQYVIPATLVWQGRAITKSSGIPVRRDDNKSSVFRSKFWVFLVLIWAFACVVFVTINHITAGR